MSPGDDLDAPLRATLERSFVDRVAGRPGAALNLDNAWWSGEPATLGEALGRLEPTGVNILARIHDRICALDPSLALWREIRWIRNVWWGGSAGFKLVWEDRARACDRLDGLWSRVARDGVLGGLEHQRATPLALLLAGVIELPDAATFREVTPLGAESVHFCVARREPPPSSLDDIHLDWCSPVRGVDPRTRRLRYAWWSGAVHWLQAMRGHGAPRFTFDVVDAIVARVEAGHARPAGWDDFAARWRKARWRLAARGADGLARAAAYLWEAEALEAAGDQADVHGVGMNSSTKSTSDRTATTLRTGLSSPGSVGG